ncbi:MAG TPA: hypothetical protein VGQ09_16550 [Chitinophagaceae bacterium]|jgi:hypothetical protein|nr:hypothetical protein [Chitinophagaceae bacterium]
MNKFSFFTFYFLLFSSKIFSQAPQLGVNIEDEFKVTAVPDKWKNESAVIIGQKTEYLFTRVASGRSYSTVVRINEYIHKRVKLQDKNALEKFSTFNYVTMGKDGNAEYKIIKANGKEETVDMKTAVEDEKDIDPIYKPIFYSLNIKSQKIAIPNLEIGDIIDYTLKSTFNWDMKADGIGFKPFIFSLANSYPTMYQQYRFTMVNGMKVQYRNYNGAPNLRFDARASVYGDKESYLSYYLLDKDRTKSSDVRWNYELRTTPSVKFRVIFLADNDPSSKGLGEATVDRAGLDPDQVYKRYAGAAAYVTPTVTSLVGYTTQYILKKKEEGVLKTDDDIIRECYYCLRKVFLEMYYKGPVHSDLEKYMTGKKLYKKILAQEKKSGPEKEEREDEIRISGVTFATALRLALAAQNIQAELQVYVPRSLGAWRDAIFMDELDFVVKVKSKRRFYFLEAFNNFDAFGTPYQYLEGAEGYSIAYDEANRYYRAAIPATTFNDNLQKQDYSISFNDAMDIVKAERVSSYLGHEKTSLIGNANLDRTYLNYDFAKYYVEQGGDKSKKKKGNDEPVIVAGDATRYDDPDKEEHIKERKEIFEKSLKEELDVDKYEDFELLKDGRFGDTAMLQFKEKFTLKKLVSKAGKNYIFEVGKLIGDQIKLEQSELAGRQVDIWIPHARTIENNISIAIPAGYMVDGLQDLNMNIDNESGSFVSSAKVDNDKLLIDTKKLYKKNFDKKEAWPNYIAFLEPAYKFSQLKIVLKKK